jgi:hypothetical protein
MSESFQTIDDIAIAFIHKLKSVNRSSLSAKPLLFLAHSLGGIVLKHALVLLANSENLKFMLDTVNGAIFFGVPNRGMNMSHLLPMVEGQPNVSLIRLLSPDSQYLSDLDEQFSSISTFRNVLILSAYETKRSQTTKVVPPLILRQS